MGVPGNVSDISYGSFFICASKSLFLFCLVALCLMKMLEMWENVR